MTAVETLDEADGSADEAVELYAELDTEDLRRFLTVHEAVPADSAPSIDEFDDWSGFRERVFSSYAGRGPSASVLADRVERFETAVRAAADDESIDHLGGGVLKDAASGGFNRISETTNEINDALMYSNAGYDVVLEPGTSEKYDSVSSNRVDLIAEDEDAEVFVESKYISGKIDNRITDRIKGAEDKFRSSPLVGDEDETTLHIRAVETNKNVNNIVEKVEDRIGTIRSRGRDIDNIDLIRVYVGDPPTSPPDNSVTENKSPNVVIVDEASE